jgi:hypothetical protein
VIWTSGRSVRKRFTASSDVLQVCLLTQSITRTTPLHQLSNDQHQAAVLTVEAVSIMMLHDQPLAHAQ